MNIPVVSVIVATFRRKEELIRALDSLAAQTFSDFEIVVVDDNAEKSRNETVSEIVEQFKNKHESICVRLIQNAKNFASAKSRNIGVEASQGKYITFLDDDDIYLPDKIASQCEFMSGKNLDYSITDLDLYFDNGKLSEHRKRDYIQSTDRDALIKYHLLYHLTGTDTFMFKSEYLRQIGGFSSENVGDEFYLMQRAIDGGGRFGYLPRCDVRAYVHTGEGGLSSGQGKIDGENKLYEYKKKFFKNLDRKSVRYITARHYAVRAFAYLRMNKKMKFVFEGIKAFLCSPHYCARLLLGGKK